LRTSIARQQLRDEPHDSLSGRFCTLDHRDIAIEIHNDTPTTLLELGPECHDNGGASPLGVLEQEQESKQRLALLSDAFVRLAPGGEQVPESLDLLEVLE